MRRVRAALTSAQATSLNIGIQLTPVGSNRNTGNGAGEVSGPIVVGGAAGGGYPCSWLVFMRGVSAGSTVEWIAEWFGMDGDYAGSVSFGIADVDASQPMVAQILNSSSGSLEWIDVTAIVDGIEHGPARVSCNV